MYVCVCVCMYVRVCVCVCEEEEDSMENQMNVFVIRIASSEWMHYLFSVNGCHTKIKEPRLLY